MPLSSVSIEPLDPAQIPMPSKVLALFGLASELHSLVLQSLVVRAARGERIGLIIGDNRFDEFALTRLARGRGFNPSALLAQIEFSRPFTCHQLHHCIVNLVGEKSSEWRALYALGLLETFWDEDIRYADAARLVHEILTRLRQIAAQGLSVLVTISPPPKETTRQELITRVMRSADMYWQPSPLALEHAERAARQIALW